MPNQWKTPNRCSWLKRFMTSCSTVVRRTISFLSQKVESYPCFSITFWIWLLNLIRPLGFLNKHWKKLVFFTFSLILRLKSVERVIIFWALYACIDWTKTDCTSGKPRSSVRFTSNKKVVGNKWRSLKWYLPTFGSRVTTQKLYPCPTIRLRCSVFSSTKSVQPIVAYLDAELGLGKKSMTKTRLPSSSITRYEYL